MTEYALHPGLGQSAYDSLKAFLKTLYSFFFKDTYPVLLEKYRFCTFVYPLAKL